LLDILRPPLVVVDRVDAESQDLGVAPVEFRLQPRHVAELGRAYGREVLRMRKQDGPSTADPVVEGDGALCGLRLEVRRFGLDSERHVVPPVSSVKSARPQRVPRPGRRYPARLYTATRKAAALIAKPSRRSIRVRIGSLRGVVRMAASCEDCAPKYRISQ